MIRVLLACLALLPWQAVAHPLAPALLALHELGGETVEVEWKTSTLVVPSAPTRAVLPPHCAARSVPVESQHGDAIVTRWSVDCGARGLVGSPITIVGLGAAGTEALVRIGFPDGRVVQRVLRPTEASFVVPARRALHQIVRDYAGLGIEHILTGADHLLFVLGLMLLVADRRRLVRTITAFTLGHSLTLAFAVLDLVQVPSRPAELAIALTVLALGTELARAPASPSLLRRWPGIMAGAFGLLHGLGFAGALREVGLPQGDIPLALVAFNAGIELGQLGFVLVLLAVASAARRLRPALPRWAPFIPAYTIGSLAAWWCFERASQLIP